MWRIKRQRTKPRTIGNRVLYPKFNGTARPKRYEMRNTYLDSVCSTCKTKQCSCSRRNPILGYRKQLIDYFADKVTGLGIAKTFIHIDILYEEDGFGMRPNCWIY